MTKKTQNVELETPQALHIADVGTRYFSILKMTDESHTPMNILEIQATYTNKINVMKFEVADNLAYQTEEEAIKAMAKLPKPACYVIQPIWVCL